MIVLKQILHTPNGIPVLHKTGRFVKHPTWIFCNAVLHVFECFYCSINCRGGNSLKCCRMSLHFEVSVMSVETCHQPDSKLRTSTVFYNKWTSSFLCSPYFRNTFPLPSLKLAHVLLPFWVASSKGGKKKNWLANKTAFKKRRKRKKNLRK